MTGTRALMGLLAVVLVGAAPLDSQVVLQNYARALGKVRTPAFAIFSYAVSQAGPTDIEQRHRIYRSASSVRDETISIDGARPKGAAVTIGKRDDRYALGRLAPRPGAYELLFVRATTTGARTDYLFDAIPYAKAPAGFTVTQVTIDGTTFLPRAIAFRTTSLTARGDGEVRFAPFGPYWMPVLATVAASVGGRPARERIAFGEYRFPTSLPPSTFGKH
jgi:hypothetical protein